MCASELKPNYAFKPIADQALRSNQTIVPQRLNAALGPATKSLVDQAMELSSPHIPLGTISTKAEAILRGFAPGTAVALGADGSLSLVHETVNVTAYVTDGVVTSVLYNDPLGRGAEDEKEAKVAAYLARYGSADAWECRMDNGWMRYWYNVPGNVTMVYGLHKDVIRFNLWHPPKGVA